MLPMAHQQAIWAAQARQDAYVDGVSPRTKLDAVPRSMPAVPPRSVSTFNSFSFGSTSTVMPQDQSTYYNSAPYTDPVTSNIRGAPSEPSTSPEAVRTARTVYTGYYGCYLSVCL